MVQSRRGRGGGAPGLRTVTLAIDAVNRALEREGWARDKLAAYAGRTVRIEVGPIARSFAIDAEGRLAESSVDPDLTLAVSPLQLPGLLAAPELWSQRVDTEGDVALAATLGELASTLPWFVERTFAAFLGPIVGQQVADAGRRVLELSDYAAERFTANVARYLSEEAKLAVDATEAVRFAESVAATAARVEALEVRIDALSNPEAPPR
jgi:ubiquinone biosynthesis protein UbiJ